MVDDRPVTDSDLALPTLEETKTINESVFWDEDDPRWHLTGLDKFSLGGIKPTTSDEGQIIDLSLDSYIFVFCGTRGAGKSLTMTRYAGQSVAFWNKRLISNYPIRFVLIRIDGKRQLVKSEPLDLYKLLCFDKDYQNCIIIIDEAPDIISHLASMTWKNRLLNIFVRQLRKNRNSLMLGAQWFSLVDRSMRLQADILIRCKDAFRLYGDNQGLCRGSDTLVDIWDNSGQWLGNGHKIDADYQFDFTEPDDSLQFPGRPIWGAYDTFFQQDIWESLAKVDVHFQTIKVGAPEEEESTEYLDKAAKVIDSMAAAGGKIESRDFYSAIGDLPQKEKNKLGAMLNKAGVRRSTNNRFMDFDNFSVEKFLKGGKE